MKATTIDRKLRSLKTGERFTLPATQLSNEEYHKVKAVSSSRLKDLMKVHPAYVYAKYFKQQIPRKVTEAFLIGGATHKLILETRSFGKEYIVLPENKKRPTEKGFNDLNGYVEKANEAKANELYWFELDHHNDNVELAGELAGHKKVTPAQVKIVSEAEDLKKQLEAEDREPKKAEQNRLNKAEEIKDNISWWNRYTASIRIPEEGKKRPTASSTKAIEKGLEAKETINFWSDFDKQAKGKECLTREQYNEVDGYRNAVRAHPQANNLLKGGDPEVSTFWRDEETGLLCKARADYKQGDILLDVKSTADNSPDAFARQCANLLYNLQQAMYMDGFRATNFAFVAVEKSKDCPFVEVYTMDDDFFDIGNIIYRDALTLYKKCLDTGVWNSYNDGIGTLKAPNWFSYKYK